MFDFTQPNYLYQNYENNLILRNALKKCKTEEEKENVIRSYQGANLFAKLVSFILAVAVCGILSLLS